MTIANHELIARSFAAAMNRLDRAALERLVTADFVAEWPQSRERIEGFDNFYSVLAAYPKVDDVRPSNDEQNVVVHPTSVLKAIAPTYALVSVEGGGNSGTFTLRVAYPDGSVWWAVNLYRLRDGRICFAETFFAPEYPAPDWRAHWVVQLPASNGPDDMTGGTPQKEDRKGGGQK